MEIYNQFINQLIQYQFKINSFISSTIKNINDENLLSASFLVLGIAFLYGLIHAAGPGHGKALVAFYFATNKNSYKEAFTLGYLISIVHTLSALTLTFGIYFILEKMFRQNFNYYSKITMQISATMIVLVGVYIIVSSYLTRKQKEKKVDKNKSKYALAFSIGIVPCPGVMTIVLFCIILKKFALGILAAICMSIGMGLTISLVGILSILLNKKANNFLESKAFILELFGGVLILLLGIILFNINL
ncbi:nickel transporter [Arcobacter sp. F155]|uniref:nickel/cobalt transporter n=1 Tax=Arcobacter sp. F155 TaxID=2044512 RepID=UPI00100BDECC|nr:nickel transporter [Arcobacter sp. F155]RXJ77081.1 nickel transporter [Arcobacter sp. F155]